jgi:hypothetical protein
MAVKTDREKQNEQRRQRARHAWQSYARVREQEAADQIAVILESYLSKTRWGTIGSTIVTDARYPFFIQSQGTKVCVYCVNENVLNRLAVLGLLKDFSCKVNPSALMSFFLTIRR